jgi:hypothetical protein
MGVQSYESWITLQTYKLYLSGYRYIYNINNLIKYDNKIKEKIIVLSKVGICVEEEKIRIHYTNSINNRVKLD